jgi:hypothetical protein
MLQKFLQQTSSLPRMCGYSIKLDKQFRHYIYIWITHFWKAKTLKTHMSAKKPIKVYHIHNYNTFFSSQSWALSQSDEKWKNTTTLEVSLTLNMMLNHSIHLHPWELCPRHYYYISHIINNTSQLKDYYHHNLHALQSYKWWMSQSVTQFWNEQQAHNLKHAAVR